MPDLDLLREFTPEELRAELKRRHEEERRRNLRCALEHALAQLADGDISIREIFRDLRSNCTTDASGLRVDWVDAANMDGRC